MPRPRKPASPSRYFNLSREVIRLAVLMYMKYPLSLKSVGDLLAELHTQDQITPIGD